MDSAREAYEKLTKDQKESLKNLNDDFSDNYLGHLLNAESKVAELHKEKANSMIVKFDNYKRDNGWRADISFKDIQIKQLESLTISLYRENTKLGEQELKIEKFSDNTKNVITAAFYSDGTKSSSWVPTMNLLAGNPDKGIVTFEVDGEKYTVEFEDLKW